MQTWKKNHFTLLHVLNISFCLKRCFRVSIDTLLLVVTDVSNFRENWNLVYSDLYICIWGIHWQWEIISIALSFLCVYSCTNENRFAESYVMTNFTPWIPNFKNNIVVSHEVPFYLVYYSNLTVDTEIPCTGHPNWGKSDESSPSHTKVEVLYCGAPGSPSTSEPLGGMPHGKTSCLRKIIWVLMNSWLHKKEWRPGNTWSHARTSFCLSLWGGCPYALEHCIATYFSLFCLDWISLWTGLLFEFHLLKVDLH